MAMKNPLHMSSFVWREMSRQKLAAQSTATTAKIATADGRG
jgi:hypothetical protein